MPFMMVWPDFEVGLHPEGRVFGSQTRQGDAHLFLVGLGLRLDRDLDHRLREGHGFQNHRLGRIAERVAGGGFLQTGQRDDVAGKGFVDFFAVDRVHHHHAANALFALPLVAFSIWSPFFSWPE